jgi:hypothetical protein
MNDLSELMRAATASPPPTSITAAGLVREERRRARVRLVVAAVAASGLALASVPLLAGSGLVGGYGPGTARTGVAGLTDPGGVPWPTEAPDSAVPRLNGVLATALSATGVTISDGYNFGFQPTAQASVAPATFIGSQGSYLAQLMLSDAQGRGLFQVVLDTSPRPSRTGCSQPSPCTQAEALDGSYVETYTVSNENSGGHLVSVIVYRRDHTRVQLYASDFYYPDTVNLSSPGAPKVVRSRPSPVLTAPQLITIGTTPGLTLYP